MVTGRCARWTVKHAPFPFHKYYKIDNDSNQKLKAEMKTHLNICRMVLVVIVFVFLKLNIFVLLLLYLT